jgi:small subunit ribosomal protein S16
MPVKMRLARHGRKRYAYYHIVVANSRAPRDGRYIERIGFYNPNTNPATIDLDFDKAYDWLTKGAQPTDTVRAILSYKGVLYKKHLMGGVKKGAFDEEEAQRRFEKWIAEKEANIRAKKENIENEVDVAMKKLLAAETKKKEQRAAGIAARNAELAKEAEANVEEEASAEAADAEAPSEEAEVSDKAAEETAEESGNADSEKQKNE